ncbi:MULTISPECIES: hypothetical protein [unclassified Streptomyces]|uniref:hypothetical protein n=1 Tax=unclassified Streptomyces TaxID=2593676 RepID=UPI00278C4A6E|nr:MULTISPECIES: hypothetical protein [unclassified Streptomyces]
MSSAHLSRRTTRLCALAVATAVAAALAAPAAAHAAPVQAPVRAAAPAADDQSSPVTGGGVDLAPNTALGLHGGARLALSSGNVVHDGTRVTGGRITTTGTLLVGAGTRKTEFYAVEIHLDTGTVTASHHQGGLVLGRFDTSALRLAPSADGRRSQLTIGSDDGSIDSDDGSAFQLGAQAASGLNSILGTDLRAGDPLLTGTVHARIDWAPAPTTDPTGLLDVILGLL